MARVGGDEFAMILFGADVHGVRSVVSSIRSAIDAAPATGDFAMSISIGSSTGSGGESFDDHVAGADGEMYDEKRQRFRADATLT